MTGTFLSPQPDTASDPLLTGASVFLAFLIGLLFATTFVTIGVGAILTVQRDQAYERIAAVGAPASSYGLVVFAFILIVVLFLLMARFLLDLRRIIATVRHGDPFFAENARRLKGMGWLAVAAQLVWLVLVAIARWTAQYVEGRSAPDPNLVGGLLLILVLFILARVFRLGAEMRTDLEGTV